MKNIPRLSITLAVPVIFILTMFIACRPRSSGNITRPELAIVSITAEDFKNEFIAGETFSTGNMKITVSYSDNTTRTYAAADLTGLKIYSDEFNRDTIGKYYIFVTYQGFIYPYYVKVIKPTAAYFVN